MTVRAKFWVREIHQHHTNDPTAVSATVKLAPVYDDGTKQNKDWSKYTPQGEISMMITNPGAIEQFELGKSYFVDFTPA
jgi:hypothetical protein